MPTTAADILPIEERIRALPRDLRLATAELDLRPLVPGDAAAIHALVGEWEVARWTSNIPHPYEPGMAEAWIAENQGECERGEAVVFAIERRADRALVGAIGLMFDAEAPRAEVGYWIGRPYWNHGYATEALNGLLRLAFGRLQLDSVVARAMDENGASMRVQEKAGFALVGDDEINAPARGRSFPGKRRLMTAADFAARESVPARTVLVVAVALVDADGRVLLARRPEGKPMAGLWEFPGGKVHEGEMPEAALVRELKEELDIDTAASCLAPLTFASHRYDHFHLLMPLYVCRVWQGRPLPREGQELAWVRPARLADYPMPPADIPLIPVLRDLL
jgi:8-oxo-dGTP diphosphatase